MRRNLLLVLLLLTLMLTSTGAALAQSGSEPFCGELSDADCTILADSQKAMMDVESLTTGGEITLKVAGIPNAPVEELAFNIAHDTVIELDPAVMKGLTEMQAQLATAKPADLQGLMQDYTDLVVKLYSTLGLDLNLTVTLPQEIADLLTEQAGGSVKVPTEIKVKARMVDGYLYVNLDDLAESIPELQEFKGWFGADVASFIRKALDQANLQQASSASGAELQAGLGAGTFLSSEQFRTMIDQYVAVERQEDSEVGDQKVAVFGTTFDFGGFVASEAFQDMLKGQLDLINKVGEQQISPQELDEGLLALKFLGPSLFQSLKFEIVKNVGVEDNYIYRSETHFNWDLKTIMGFVAMAQGGGKSPTMPKTAPVINFDVQTDYNDFNAAPTIEKPEDAIIIPLDQVDLNSIQ